MKLSLILNLKFKGKVYSPTEVLCKHHLLFLTKKLSCGMKDSSDIFCSIKVPLKGGGVYFSRYRSRPKHVTVVIVVVIPLRRTGVVLKGIQRKRRTDLDSDIKFCGRHLHYPF